MSGSTKEKPQDSRRSSINTTDGSSVYADEAAYAACHRTKLLLSSIDKVLNGAEGHLHQQLSRHCLKPMARRVKKEVFQNAVEIGDKYINQWRQEVQRKINILMAENEVTRLLYNMDEMDTRERQANQNKEAWRPSGLPRADMKDFTVIRMLEYKEKLEKSIEETGKELQANVSAVERGREEVMMADKEISELGKEIKNGLKILKGKMEDANGRKLITNEELAKMLEKIKQMG